MGIIGVLFALAIVVFLIAAMWKVFEKAGQPGWAAIIPIYNYYIMTKIAEKPEWWTILMIIPYVNLIFIVWIWNRIVKRFGKTEGFTVGVVLLGIIFIPILGFGDAKYKALGPDDNSNSDILDDDLLLED
ncbi:MAG: DUF5684 domain-containing protein [Flavobacteriales bacterium]